MTERERAREEAAVNEKIERERPGERASDQKRERGESECVKSLLGESLGYNKF